jgi:hypothetical protein
LISSFFFFVSFLATYLLGYLPSVEGMETGWGEGVDFLRWDLGGQVAKRVAIPRGDETLIFWLGEAGHSVHKT